MSTPAHHESQAELLAEAIRILDAWQVPFSEQPALLGLPDDSSKRSYNRIRLGTQPPSSSETYERAYLINRIHQATLTLFPFSEASANLWPQVPQRPFGGKTALEMMHQYGLAGMRKVDLAVDNQYHPLDA